MNSITTIKQENARDKERSLLFDDNWRLLATAIVTQAGEELKTCKQHVTKLTKELDVEKDIDKRASKLFRIKKYEAQMDSIRRFFNSQWFDALLYISLRGRSD